MCFFNAFLKNFKIINTIYTSIYYLSEKFVELVQVQWDKKGVFISTPKSRVSLPFLLPLPRIRWTTPIFFPLVPPNLFSISSEFFFFFDPLLHYHHSKPSTFLFSTNSKPTRTYKSKTLVSLSKSPNFCMALWCFKHGNHKGSDIYKSFSHYANI